MNKGEISYEDRCYWRWHDGPGHCKGIRSGRGQQRCSVAVAELFRKELASGDFKVKQVFFAVPSTRWDEDFAKFEHVLANFPERNEESYAQVAARAAAARAAEQAQAAAEDDEDDDDWRKYL